MYYSIRILWNSPQWTNTSNVLSKIVPTSRIKHSTTLPYQPSPSLPPLPITPSLLHHTLPSITMPPIHHSPPLSPPSITPPLSFNIQCSRINLCSSSVYHSTSYHTIPCHTIPSFQTCHRLSRDLFSRYENYFCRLQYWFIGLHLLLTGPLYFCVILSYKWMLYGEYVLSRSAQLDFIPGSGYLQCG